MSKPNFEIEDKNTGKKYWISRSVALCGVVHVQEILEYEEHKTTMSTCSTGEGGKYEEKEISWKEPSKVADYVLVNKRGKNTPNEQGKWNLVCGYLDYDETLQEGITREVSEECNIYIKPELWQFDGYDDSITDEKQNVTMRFRVDLTMEEYMNLPKIDVQGEEDEVETVELMLINEENLKNREWAFNHKEIIEKQKFYIRW